MANAIQQAGGAAEPSSFAPLHTNRMFTGLWTNRNPLSDASVSTNMEKYGLGLQDSIIAGLNTELSSKLTLRRRYGTSVYNSQSFPPINRFYSFNTFTLTTEAIRVLADTAATVYDATGPSTKTAIWTKSAGAGPTFFLGVGNNLYFTNGVDNKQWNAPAKTWTPNTQYFMGDTVLDSNGHVQKVVGFAYMAIATIAVAAMTGSTGNQATITLSASTGYLGGPSAVVASNVPALNNIPFNAVETSSTTFMWFSLPSGISPFAPANTGGYLASTRSSGGTSGGAAPPWVNVLNGVTGDGQILWQMIGPNVVDWGIQAPLNAPIVTQSVRTNPYSSWLPSTIFATQAGSTQQLIIKDPNNNLQKMVPGNNGSSGSTAPAWNATLYAVTADNQIQWQNEGPAAWAANHAYLIGAPVSVNVVTGTGTQAMTFYCITQGTSGATQPVYWPPTIGAVVADGSTGLTWQNIGLTLAWTASTVHTSTNVILDFNGYIQTILQPGKTGAILPTFQTGLSAQTVDNQAVWVNTGAFSAAATAPTQYGYAYRNSVTGDISNMSPASAPFLLKIGNQTVVQGIGSTDSQVDQVYIYRTAQGGSTFLYLGQVPNVSGATWTFTDTTPDSGLNVTIQAQVNREGTVLPRGATCMAYHLQRIFVAVGNVTYVSSGPDASSGNAGFNTAFTCQSQIICYWVSPLGLIILTVRDSYIILGSGTADDPLYQTTFVDGLPLLHYDAFTTHLTTPYMLLGTNMLVALDPSAGITEVGFPIADKLETEFNAATAYVTYHTQSSKESALYVDDGVGSWYRMSATTAPETGLNWSPKATLGTPSSAVQSVEVSPGVKRLLIGPGAASGPIRQRDLTTNTDLGIAFAAHATFGSIVLAHPGELAALAFITLEARKIGSRAALSVLLGEIFGTSAAPFEPLGRTRQDPTNLPPSNTLYSDRYHFMQSQNPAWCRHFQMDVAWPAEDAANELLTFTVFGQTWQEYRSQ